MRCYYHSGAEAVGICKHCARGVCSACAADVQGSVACRNRCEQEVADIIRLMAQSKRSFVRTAGIIRRNAAFYLACGLIFVAVGALVDNSTVAWMSAPLGVAFLAMAAWSFVAARRYAAPDPGAPSA